MALDPGSIPRLSVVVAGWNAAGTIGAAVASVLDQADVPLECIVVDDGSTDGTSEAIVGAAGADPRLVLLRSPVNEGVSVARNRALDVARGEWLAFLDADDRLLPGGLAAMLRAADEQDALVVVGQRISTDGERTWIPVLYDLPDIREPGVKSLASNSGLLYYAGPVGKLFHRSCARGLRFEGRMLGDQPWVVRAMLRAGDRIVVVGDTVYEWRRPHPDRYVPTITASRERSATLGAEAVTMAARAFAIVSEEIRGTVEGSARDLLERTYFERLVRADLAAQLAGAVRRGDPALDEMFGALSTFLDGIPASIVESTDVVARNVLEPPLRRWHRVPPSGRAAYLDLLRACLVVDPDLPSRASGRLPRLALRLATRLPPGAGLPLAAALVIASRAVPLALRRPVSS